MSGLFAIRIFGEKRSSYREKEKRKVFEKPAGGSQTNNLSIARLELYHCAMLQLLPQTKQNAFKLQRPTPFYLSYYFTFSQVLEPIGLFFFLHLFYKKTPSPQSHQNIAAALTGVNVLEHDSLVAAPEVTVADDDPDVAGVALTWNVETAKHQRLSAAYGNGTSRKELEYTWAASLALRT